ncbi:MAG: sulfurtransferase [Bacteroidota bacterium]
MSYYTVISPSTAAKQLHNPKWRFVDCRFSLADTEAGRTAYATAHLPNAYYAHLDDDLSGEILPGQTGRHPLPEVEAMEQLFLSWGIEADTQVVVYDDKRGAIAARLWWMLRYCGHRAVAVLDGGWTAWQAADLPTTAYVPAPGSSNFRANVQHHWLQTANDVATTAQQPGHLVDSRAARRYQGVEEPIDPVAGHIPGAINLPFADNWDAAGKLRSPAALHSRFADLPSAEETTFYCGSGVTACHNLLAVAHAGLGDARLYAGSWSDWITDPERGVATGEK